MVMHIISKKIMVNNFYALNSKSEMCIKKSSKFMRTINEKYLIDKNNIPYLKKEYILK